MESIGVVGIGGMGQGLAINAAKAGYPCSVYKRNTPSSEAAASKLERYGVKSTGSMGELLKSVDILVLCLPGSPEVEEVLLGKNGLTEHSPVKVKTVLDFTTAHPDSTRKLARILKEMGIDMLDTPMSGGPKTALEGTINLVVGGEREVFERYEALLRKVSLRVFHAGGHGAGNMIKLVNNYMCFLNQTVTASMSLMLDGMDISREAYIDFIGNSGGNSVGFTVMMNGILAGSFDPGFTVNLASKDLDYCRNLFEGRDGFPVIGELARLFNEAKAAGLGERGVSAIYYLVKEIHERMSGG